MSSFVGREDETAALLALLHQPELRLVTLTGPPGIGKTHLARWIAEKARPVFADDVFLVSLRPKADGEDVMRAVGRIVGVAATGDVELERPLIASLKDRQPLVLLDNFDPVLDAGPVIARLLATCPGLKCLVTSRAPLRVLGEHVFVLSPLPVPDRVLQADVDTLLACPSVALFVDAARRASTDFNLTREHVAAVAAICVLLDGLPLSLELAASQTKLFSPQALLAEFERQRASLRRMSAGSGEIARHQTLRATIRWSHDLLSSQERQLFRRLAVFVGGADIDAIYAVASQATGEDEPDSVLEVGLTLNALHALVDAGLVYREDAADVPHFTMLNPIREFALEELASSGEQPAIRELHARCHLKMIESSRSAADCVSLGADQDNVDAALRWRAMSR